MKSLKSAARRGGAVLAAGLTAAALASCSAGQISQTADQVAAVDGARAGNEDDTVVVRDVTVLIDDEWSDAALKFVLINQDPDDVTHRLRSVTVDGTPVKLSENPPLQKNCNLVADSAAAHAEQPDHSVGCTTYAVSSLPNDDFAVGGRLDVRFMLDDGDVIETEATIAHPTLKSGTYDRPADRTEGVGEDAHHGGHGGDAHGEHDGEHGGHGGEHGDGGHH